MIILAGPIYGEIIDAKTGSPLPNMKISFKIDVCPGSQIFNVGGCNSDIVFDKEVASDENGKFFFPFKIIWKSPLASVSWQNLSISDPEAKNYLYSDVYTDGQSYADIDGSLEGYEGYGEEIQFALSYHKTYALIPLENIMSVDDCPETMQEADRRRCLYHLALRESSFLGVANQYSKTEDFSVDSFYTTLLDYYYQTIIFGDCNDPAEKVNPICRLISDVIANNESFCEVLGKDDFRRSNSDAIKKTCEIYHVGSLSKEGKVPPVILSHTIATEEASSADSKGPESCNKYQDYVLRDCLDSYALSQARESFANNFQYIQTKLYDQYFQLCSYDQSALPDVIKNFVPDYEDGLKKHVFACSDDECRAIKAIKTGDLNNCIKPVFRVMACRMPMSSPATALDSEQNMQYLEDDCYSNVAFDKKDRSICDMIKSEDESNECRKALIE